MTASCEAEGWTALHETIAAARYEPDTIALVEAMLAEARKHALIPCDRVLATAIMIGASLVDSVLALEPHPEKKRIIAHATITAFGREVLRKCSDKIAVTVPEGGHA